MESSEFSLVASLLLMAWGAWAIIRRDLSFSMGANNHAYNRGRRIQMRGNAARLAGIGLVIGGGGWLLAGVLQLDILRSVFLGMAVVLFVIGLLMQIVSSLKR